MRQYLFLFFILSVQGTFGQSGQPGFKKLYSGEATGATFVDIAWDGSKLIATGQFLADTTLPNGALNGQLYMELDTNGNVLFTDIYFPPNDAVTSDLKNTISTFDGNTFYITTQMYNATNENLLTIYKDSERVVSKTITTNGLRAAMFYAQKYNGGIIFSGRDQSPTDLDSDGLLVKVNDAGEELWQKKFNFPETDCYLSEPYILGPNSILLPGAEQKWALTGPVTASWVKTWLAMVDSNGVVQSEWRSPKNLETGVSTRMIRLPKKSWLYATSSLVFNPSPLDNWGLHPKIVCRDSNFNLLWEREIECYPSPANYTIDLQQSMDGNLLMAGRLSTSLYWGGCFIQKFAPLGQIIWNYFDPCISDEDCSHYFGGLVEIPSGSIFCSGYYINDVEGKVYGLVTKLNKNGCRDTLCTNTSAIKEIVNMNKTSRIYPNPTTGLVTISDALGDIMQVFDISGRLVLQTKISGEKHTTIDLQGLTTGTYLLQMQEKNLRLTYQIIKQ